MRAAGWRGPAEGLYPVSLCSECVCLYVFPGSRGLVSVSPCLCVSVSLSLYLSVSLCSCLCVSLFVSASVCFSLVSLSGSLSACLSVHVSLCLSVSVCRLRLCMVRIITSIPCLWLLWEENPCQGGGWREGHRPALTWLGFSPGQRWRLWAGGGKRRSAQGGRGLAGRPAFPGTGACSLSLAAGWLSSLTPLG